jgi:hypothetical protein
MLLGLVAGILAVSIPSYAVVVDGYCYLENQPNHAGSRVLFQAASPTAVTDSVYTDQSGYYEIALELGVYDVYFTHESYTQEIIENQLFSEPTTLPNVTLLYIPSGVPLSGSLSGVLEARTYSVIGDLMVEEDSSLTIEAGAIFYFLGDFDFCVNGLLQAIGTESDSIIFAAAPGVSHWTELRFTSSSSSECIVSYCVFENGGLIQCYDCAPTISHSLFTGIPYDGIACMNGASPNVSYCMITGNSGGVGIWGSGCSPTFDYCTIRSNTNTGIQCYQGCTPTFDHCVISDQGYAGMYCDGCSPRIINCTFAGNNHEGMVLYNNATPAVVNTIIAGNGGYGIEFGNSQNASITYSDIHGNNSGNIGGQSPQYLCELMMVNANGDSCDIFLNILEDPLFVNAGAGDYHLQEFSPCIDAGDPNSPLDPDGTVADIGAFYYDQSPLTGGSSAPRPVTYQMLQNYPNPFNPITTISFALPTAAQVTLVVYDILGRQVATVAEGWMGAGIHKVNFDGSGLSSGIYFYRLQAGGFTAVKKLVLLK